MFHAELREGEWPTVVLRDTDADSLVEAIPARGGLVSRFRVGTEEILYMDPATLTDLTKNVRGGIPVLFPIAGKLTDGHYTVDGVPYCLPQHGFARQAQWAIMSTRMVDCAETVFQLTDDAQTREVFPYEFEMRLQVALAGPKLSLSATHRNTGARTLPLHFGYHPYFLLPQAVKADAVIETDATRVLDNVTGQLATLDQGAPATPAPPAGESPAPAEPARQRIDLTVPELDVHLLDHHLNGSSLQAPPRPGTLRLSWSEQFRHFVIWTLRERDFVCLEPWTAAGDALNTGQNLIPVAPGESITTRFDIEWLAK